MTRTTPDHGPDDPIVGLLRRAGCVFAEEEAALLREQATGATELDELCARRAAGEPLEHLLGWVRFGDLRLCVGPGVFVPRQRSLLLARTAVAAARARPSPLVLEAFCGVAPIAASVAAAVPGVGLHVVDTDDTALGFARRNLPDGTGIHRGAGLDALPAALRGRLDVIAAVPPYVPDSALGLLAPEARDHEPHRALLGGPDGLDHITVLIADARTWLTVGGELLIEMNTAQAEQVVRGGGATHESDIILGGDGQTVVMCIRRPEPPRSPARPVAVRPLPGTVRRSPS
ncbi:SAM-dependent methyltransferase [Gordonia terrae]|uniref:SAM-dependent methyltransferase n=1 Tax=Gordonia terrae TaxID=2055 RepID=UPI00200AADA6|nr:SAM-dependent methyltransferase [Gordonia terrae]UPW10559.1 SAM-dependent methyltransferase [Gordonia terrae]